MLKKLLKDLGFWSLLLGILYYPMFYVSLFILGYLRETGAISGYTNNHILATLTQNFAFLSYCGILLGIAGVTVGIVYRKRIILSVLGIVANIIDITIFYISFISAMKSM